MDATNNEKAEILKWMLGQIYRAEKRKKQLDERLVRIAEPSSHSKVLLLKMHFRLQPK